VISARRASPLIGNCSPARWPQRTIETPPPLPIIAGILLATIVNHGLAGALGAWITASVNPEMLRRVHGIAAAIFAPLGAGRDRGF